MTDFTAQLRSVRETLATTKHPTSAGLLTTINQLLDLLSGMARSMQQLERRNEELEEKKRNSQAKGAMNH